MRDGILLLAVLAIATIVGPAWATEPEPAPVEQTIVAFRSLVKKWLGFQPSFAMGRSATYFAVRNGETWQPGMVSKSEFAKAKAEGQFYSIMVLDRGAEEPEQGPPASVVLLQVKPDTAH